MYGNKAKAIFVTGTGTDVGKTYITALISKKLNSQYKTAYYKAAMSGNDRDTNGNLIPGDAVFVKQIANLAQETKTMCPYVYEHAYSPHLASRIEGEEVDLCKVKNGFDLLVPEYEFITVEGSGGIVCPISYGSKKIFLEDVIKELNLSALLVADAGLGTINSVVLTYNYMKSHGVNPKALVFNNYHGGIMEDDNIEMCKELTGLNVLDIIKPNQLELGCSLEDLTAIYE